MSLILLQGAMTVEIEQYLACLQHKREERVHGYRFWRGKLGNSEVIVSRTKMGIINASMATMLGIMTYQPELVINQGTAGAHVEYIKPGDIVIVEKSEYLNSLNMPVRGMGEGSNSLEWEFSNNVEAREATQEWVSYFASKHYPYGDKYIGTIGSGDIYSREVDRIKWIQNKKGNLCEDMETAAVFEICSKMDIEHIGIRVISNNEVTGKEFDPKTAKLLQQYILSTMFKK